MEPKWTTPKWSHILDPVLLYISNQKRTVESNLALPLDAMLSFLEFLLKQKLGCLGFNQLSPWRWSIIFSTFCVPLNDQFVVWGTFFIHFMDFQRSQQMKKPPHSVVNFCGLELQVTRTCKKRDKKILGILNPRIPPIRWSLTPFWEHYVW